MEPVRHGSFLEVDLTLLQSNVEELRKLNPNNQILFMVKADAYGHGLISIVDFAARECGIKEFGVATLNEGLYLRESLPDLKIEIYVFSELGIGLEEHKEVYLQNRLIPVIARREDLNVYLQNPSLKERLPLCLKFNTGMNRLGLSWEYCDDVIKTLKDHGVKKIFHLMSHMANASMSMKANNRNKWQRERFANIKKAIEESGIELQFSSLANSGTIEQGEGAEETHIRPGLMLYGPSSLIPPIREQSLWKGKVISSLKTYVLHTFEVKKGDPLSYGSTPAPSSGRVAILAMGYGDGVSTFYQGASLFHKGVEGKVCARVCMDMIYVLFPEGTDIHVGETFTIWGHEPEEIERLSQQTKILSYELVIQLTTRVSRLYRVN